jgi:anti-anti-sigma regulatory factor
MLRITELHLNGRLVLKLEGRFSAAWVDELDACWRAAVARSDDESVWVDLSDVSLVDLAGQEQLTRMHRAGARFLTRGCVMPELVREIYASTALGAEAHSAKAAVPQTADHTVEGTPCVVALPSSRSRRS